MRSTLTRCGLFVCRISLTHIRAESRLRHKLFCSGRESLYGTQKRICRCFNHPSTDISRVNTFNRCVLERGRSLESFVCYAGLWVFFFFSEKIGDTDPSGNPICHTAPTSLFDTNNSFERSSLVSWNRLLYSCAFTVLHSNIRAAVGGSQR